MKLSQQGMFSVQGYLLLIISSRLGIQIIVTERITSRKSIRQFNQYLYWRKTGTLHLCTIYSIINWLFCIRVFRSIFRKYKIVLKVLQTDMVLNQQITALTVQRYIKLCVYKTKWSDIILHKSRQMSLVNSGALITLHAVKMHVSLHTKHPSSLWKSHVLVSNGYWYSTF